MGPEAMLGALEQWTVDKVKKLMQWKVSVMVGSHVNLRMQVLDCIMYTVMKEGGGGGAQGQMLTIQQQQSCAKS